MSLLALLVAAVPAAAHLHLQSNACYGYRNNNLNTIYPLSQGTFDEWWFHGYVDDPPADDKIVNLPAGGVTTQSVGCSTGTPGLDYTAGVCDSSSGGDGGTTHAVDVMRTPFDLLQDVRGCGIAIAYESDASLVQPEDFVVISVNTSCPWRRSNDFHIPADLPACPEGGCTCMWGWVHSPNAGGAAEMYFNGFRCNVTGATGTVPLPTAQLARKCNVDKNNCTVGAKSPHYWWQKERNNNFQGYSDPPFYNTDYGYQNGAQTDLWETGDESLWAHECDWAPGPQLYDGAWSNVREVRGEWNGTSIPEKVRQNATNPASQCVNWTKTSTSLASTSTAVTTSVTSFYSTATTDAATQSTSSSSESLSASSSESLSVSESATTVSQSSSTLATEASQSASTSSTESYESVYSSASSSGYISEAVSSEVPASTTATFEPSSTQSISSSETIASTTNSATYEAPTSVQTTEVLSSVESTFSESASTEAVNTGSGVSEEIVSTATGEPSGFSTEAAYSTAGAVSSAEAIYSSVESATTSAPAFTSAVHSSSTPSSAAHASPSTANKGNTGGYNPSNGPNRMGSPKAGSAVNGCSAEEHQPDHHSTQQSNSKTQQSNSKGHSYGQSNIHRRRSRN
ncbi:uncharacterized protein EHS24_009342 [Apiotrichum porosum]|uniref:Uncharacterized protein n=1 Tax=Apiotrichum porosum TaxID=105984 RepID=A0A427XLF2_9TREE|nr:uncharacterized protein EHS24_009342 [Apiotrichum porosum]RSH79690.1 hypothetical protein EHS24_009342 [Apiotrichum porosum]